MTPEEQKRFDAIHDVVHDYANFVSSAEMMITGKDATGAFLQPPTNTHVAHAFYLNCRKLADFFKSRGRPTDVKAEDYATGLQPTLTVFDSWRDPIDKQLAHISQLRAVHAREITTTVSKDLYAELKAAWRDFRKQVDAKYAGEFANQIAKRKAPHADGTPSEFRSYDLD